MPLGDGRWVPLGDVVGIAEVEREVEVEVTVVVRPLLEGTRFRVLSCESVDGGLVTCSAAFPTSAGGSLV